MIAENSRRLGPASLWSGMLPILAWPAVALIAGALVVGLAAGTNPVLVALAGTALVSGLLAYRSPRTGLFIFLIWVAFDDYAKRLLFLSDQAVTLPEYQFVLGLPDLILLAAVASIASRSLKNWRLHLRVSYLDLPVFMFLAWNLLSLWRPQSSLYIGLVGFKLSGIYVLVYLLAASTVRRWSNLAPLLRLMAVLAMIAVTYSFYQALFGFTGFEERWHDSGLTALDEGTIGLEGINRVFSTFASHEQFGFFVAAAMLFLSLLRPRRPLRPELRWLYLGAGLLRSLSRSSWVAFGVALGAPQLIFARRKHRFARLLALVLVGLVLFLAAAPVAGWILQHTNSAFLRRAVTTGTYEARTRTFENFVSDATYRTPLGNGLGSMWGASRTGQRLIPLVSHSGAVDIVYELGWVGLALFGFILFRFYRMGLQISDRSPPGHRRRVALAMLGLVTGVIVANTFVATLLILRPMAVFFWFAIGVVSRLPEWPEEGNHLAPGRAELATCRPIEETRIEQ